MIPQGMQGIIAAEDIVQETFVHAIRDIRHCRADNETSFRAWLKAIADHRLHDTTRRMQAEKRRGDRQRLGNAMEAANTSSIIDLCDMLSAGSQRPSRSAMRHEAIAAVRNEIRALPNEYRKAVQLRLLEGKSLEETAVILNRSPRAIQGLVDRAKKKLRDALGRLSRYE